MNTKQIIDSAYHFEIESIESNSALRNPYYDTIKQMDNGATLWEAVNLMVESYTNYREQYEELERFTNQVCVQYDNMKRIIEEQKEEINDLKQQLFKNGGDLIYNLPF